MPVEGDTAESRCVRKLTSRSAGDEGDPVREIEEGWCRDFGSGVHGKGTRSREQGNMMPYDEKIASDLVTPDIPESGLSVRPPLRRPHTTSLYRFLQI